MKNMDILQILQTVFIGFTVIIAIVAVAKASEIGQRQNEINVQALALQDFAEVFFMPQSILKENKKTGERELVGWNLLVKNVSSYPIYLTEYTLNKETIEVGGSAIPNNPESWYGIPIPKDADEFSVSVKFEDHRGKKYETEGSGTFKNNWWIIHSTRRREIK